MKRILLVYLLLVSLAAGAQTSSDMKYRRSSLYTMMVENPSQERIDVIKKAFLDYKVSEKFNNHNLDNRLINLDKEAEDKNARLKRMLDSFGSEPGVAELASSLAANSNTAKLSVDQKTVLIDNYLDKNLIAKQMIAKWFNRDAKGAFDMKLVAERGQYNASEMDASIAKKNKKGLAMLADAGEELITNTFILVSDFKYVNKEEVAAKASGGLKALSAAASFVPGASNVSTAASVAAVGVTVAGKGYVVKTTSHLYQLYWNEEIASKFYEEMWMDSKSIDPKKKSQFDYVKLFDLVYIGYDVAWADVQSSIFTNKSDDELITRATNRALDAVIVKLQKNHEEFRTKTPLFSVDPLTAKIGLKEGVSAGDKYEVLEQRQDEDGRTYYEKVGMVKVDGSQIWDNRYMATGEVVEGTNKTSFLKISGKDFYPGLLIKQK